MSLVEEMHAAHKARLARMGGVPRYQPKYVIEEVVVEPEPAKPEPPSFNEWVRRQERLNPLPKAPWFCIENEIELDNSIKVEDIIRAVSKHFDVPKVDMLSARRTARISRARQVAYYLSRTLTTKSYPDIARRFGGRDHTTAIHGAQKIERLRKTDAALDGDIEAIKGALA